MNNPAELMSHHGKGLIEVDSDSNDWKLLEYELQLSFSSSRVRLNRLWHISVAEQLVLQFEKRCSGRLRLFSWKNLDEIGKENSIQEIQRRGFSIPDWGMKFEVGNHPIFAASMFKKQPLASLPHNGNEDEIAAREKRTFEMILCEICIGRTHPVEEISRASRHALPSGFDTSQIMSTSQTVDSRPTNSLPLKSNKFELPSTTMFYASANRATHPESAAAPGFLPQDTFRHEYMLYTSSQVLPKALAVCQFDASDTEGCILPFCDNCREYPATIWCFADAARLCEACDTTLHSHNKVVAGHQRGPIYSMPRAPSTCYRHPAQLFDLFCQICELPMCVSCHTSQHHPETDSEGRKLRISPFRPLNEAYRSRLSYSFPLDEILTERRDQLLSQLPKVAKLSSQVDNNMTEAQERVLTILENTMSTSQSRTDEMVSKVVDLQYIYRRNLTVLEWSSHFLGYLYAVLPPSDFLFAWCCHSQYCQEIGRENALLAKEDNEQNMLLEGRITLSTDKANSVVW